MNIKKIEVGYMGVNCYVLEDEGSAVVIDPGDDAEAILKYIREKNLNIEKILLTHGHFDHIGAVDGLKKQTGAQVLIHKEDAPLLSDNEKNLSFMTDDPPVPCKADALVRDGDVIEFGNAKLKVVHVPGHSMGSVCYYDDENLFCGDTLFKDSIGRFDHGDFREEMKSLRRIMDSFSDDIKVFPGHGEATTIGRERSCNPYIVNHIN